MVPFLTNYCKKETLFADLRRSAPDSEKHTPFCVFVYKHLNTYDLCDPLGVYVEEHKWSNKQAYGCNRSQGPFSRCRWSDGYYQTYNLQSTWLTIKTP